MGKKYKLLIFILFSVAILALVLLFLNSDNIAILSPKGIIATHQRDLIVISTLLMLLVVLPVFFLTFFIAWKYRAGNTKAKYTPDFDHHNILESIWWGFPCAIILILAVITWNSSHELDPFKSLDASKKPVTVQVIALQWKWLFIYPEQDIASINYLQFPEKTPINFEITADAPMNSFWIPKLGGQVYAMSGMTTKLHLMADSKGNYRGSSANISGEGFSQMSFVARSTSQADFDKWIKSVKQMNNTLTLDKYRQIAKPSKDNPPFFYASRDENLYDSVIMKYMAPENEKADSKHVIPNKMDHEGHR